MNSLSDWVALLATVLVAGLATFQVLLAAGLPLGNAAFGGANAILPGRLRAASAISSLVFVGALYVVAARAGLLGTVGKSSTVHVAIWILTVLFALSAAANLASHSNWERFLMAPVALLLAVCCALLAISAA
jgi:hypothetical protein